MVARRRSRKWRGRGGSVRPVVGREERSAAVARRIAPALPRPDHAASRTGHTGSSSERRSTEVVVDAFALPSSPRRMITSVPSCSFRRTSCRPPRTTSLFDPSAWSARPLFDFDERQLSFRGRSTSSAQERARLRQKSADPDGVSWPQYADFGELHQQGRNRLLKTLHQWSDAEMPLRRDRRLWSCEIHRSSCLPETAAG